MEVDRILGFKGNYVFLSNFYMIDLCIDSVTYKSAEHYYIAMKTIDARWRMKIMDAPTGAKAKHIGKTVPLRNDWLEKYKNQTMLKALLVKFSDPFLRQSLLNTGNAYIEETNHWNDLYWGVCNGEGKNMLGRMLMFVRSRCYD